MKNINVTMVVSTMVGLAAFGVAMYAVAKLPGGNPVTDTVKKVAEVAGS